MKLIIPMAGRGTRVRPHSHVTPKPLLPVKGKSMVERIVDTFNRVLPKKLDEGVFVLGPDFGQEVRDQLTEICERYGMAPTSASRKRPRAPPTPSTAPATTSRARGSRSSPTPSSTWSPWTSSRRRTSSRG